MRGSYNLPLEQKVKADVLRQLNDGATVVVAHVDGLNRRERDRIRHRANWWFRRHGWVGTVHYDRHAETLTAKILRKREEVDR